MTNVRTFLAASAVFGASALLVAACSGVDGGDSKFGSGGSGAGNGSGGSGAGNGSGGSGAGNGSGGSGAGSLFDASPNNDGSLNGDSACAASSQKGTQAPLDMFVMLDQSGSMSDNNKWGSVVNALTQFVQDPSTAGIGIGLQYFALSPGGGSCPSTCVTNADCAGCGPGNTCFIGTCLPGGGSDSCNAADYATAEVPIAPLPGNAQAIIASLQKHAPSTGTPSSAALQGAIQFAQGWALQHTDHKTIVVFATDGDPQECDTNVNNIANIASNGFTGNPSMSTYVIGMAGATKSNLDKWAAAGGTTASYDASNPADFIKAMNAIRGNALTCDFNMPKGEGGAVDPNKVNVTYTPPGGQPETLVNVGDANGCGPNGGWYYDDKNNPTVIKMCPATCDEFKKAQSGSGEAEVDILLGCQIITH